MKTSFHSLRSVKQTDVIVMKLVKYPCFWAIHWIVILRCLALLQVYALLQLAMKTQSRACHLKLHLTSSVQLVQKVMVHVDSVFQIRLAILKIT